MRKNFFIYFDSEGKLPQLRRSRWRNGPKHHRYWVQYVNDKPVRCNPYPGMEKAWCYSSHKFILVADISQEV